MHPLYYRVVYYSYSTLSLIHRKLLFCDVNNVQIYPDESHGLYGVTRHLYETMEAFLDDIFGPITDYFENDYYLAAAKLLEVIY